ncbi:MAG: nicotinate (nicotinamide) nucleotide adenylyltransferase [bacterium]|nr:nicotinate (nicotinamide) nucleotide adenylyltransferase [bacterium]
MRIGIFGGCFNPPHNMHKNIAISLVEKDYLDKVIYVPTGNWYDKEDLVDDIDRYNMVNLMIKDYSYLEVSDYEFGNLTCTYETLSYFQEKYGEDEIYFICGSDNFNELDTWGEYEDILDSFKIIVIKRNGDNLDKIVKKYKEYEDRIIFADIAFSLVSSTNVRKQLKDQRMSKEIEEEVLSYIRKRNLYQ